ncbi:DUF6783 domain-containing protein [uncultured Robinsoniella sp.]
MHPTNWNAQQSESIFQTRSNTPSYAPALYSP